MQKRAWYNGQVTHSTMNPTDLTFQLLEEITNGFSEERKLGKDEFHGLDWSIRYKIIKGTCEGLKYLHEELKPPIYHLDLKPSNILLDNNMVPKIADFGLSKLISDEKTMIAQTLAGTIGYLPPEYLEKKVVSNKLDIFSLGVVMLQIIAGPTGRSRSTEMPSQEFTDQVLENWTTRLQETWNGLSLEAYRQQVKTCTEIALKCLDTDRHKRPNIVDIMNKMSISHGPEAKLLSNLHDKPPSQSNEPVTLDSTLESHFNMNDIQENQEGDHHNISSKEKDENREIIRMEHPSIPIEVHPSGPWYLVRSSAAMVEVGGILASAVLRVATQKLGSAMEDRAKGQCNFHRDQAMKGMKTTLRSVRAVLEDANRQSTHDAVAPLWPKWLKATTYGISNLLDDMANKMKVLREELNEITNQHHNFRYMPYGTSHQQPSSGVNDEDATLLTMHDLVHDVARSIMVDELLDSSKKGKIQSTSCRYALLRDCSKPLKIRRAGPEIPTMDQVPHFV
uniref:non-specific serine/threonine protein kinase n=1 Tax=Oryza coarctata TaxID=77588 RepID=E0CWA6_ORYCO|nr:stemrust kinase [Oryza coarctata]